MTIGFPLEMSLKSHRSFDGNHAANQLSTGAKSPLDEVQGVVASWYLLTCFFLVQNLEHLREKLGESNG